MHVTTGDRRMASLAYLQVALLLLCLVPLSQQAPGRGRGRGGGGFSPKLAKFIRMRHSLVHKSLLGRGLNRGSLCNDESNCNKRSCCVREITTAQDGGVTFNRRGRCMFLAKLQDPTSFELNRIDDGLQQSPDIVAQLQLLSEGQDLLAICRPGTAVSAARKKRQAGNQVPAEDLLAFVGTPVILTAMDIEVMDPATTATPGPTEPTASTGPVTGIMTDSSTIVNELSRRSGDEVEDSALQNLRTRANEAESLLANLLSELSTLS